MACHEQPAPPKPDPEVQVMVPMQRDIEQKREWVGFVAGSISTSIHAQITGYLQAQNYRNGQTVEKGQLLFQIDERLFRDALERAVANLDSAKANQVDAQEIVDRYRPLVQSGAVSVENLDNAIQRNLATKAQVVAAEAAVATARQNLEFCKITAPISGVVGFATAQIGDLVSPSSGALAQIAQIDPIRVNFSIAEQEFLKLASKAQDGSSQLPKDLKLELILADGSLYPHTGTPFATNLQVEASTGTISVEALFPNPDRLIRPGMFAVVRARTGNYPKAIVIPQKAVIQYMTATMLAILKPDNTLELRPVKLGITDGSDWMVLSGLSPEDRFVVQGPLQMQSGMKVRPVPYSPTPQEAHPAQQGPGPVTP